MFARRGLLLSLPQIARGFPPPPPEEATAEAKSLTGGKVKSGIGLPMVNVLESTLLEWTYSKVRVWSTPASGPIHHVFLWIQPRGLPGGYHHGQESMKR